MHKLWSACSHKEINFCQPTRVAKICTNYGQRVQNSVFECLVDHTQFTMVKNQLKESIDIEKDSIRYYILGEKYCNRIEHVGVQRSFDLAGPLII